MNTHPKIVSRIGQVLNGALWLLGMFVFVLFLLLTVKLLSDTFFYVMSNSTSIVQALGIISHLIGEPK